MKTVFLRALEAEDKAAALLTAIRDPEAARDHQRFEVEATNFSKVPRSPFAYWVSERFRSLFGEHPRFRAGGRTAKQGLATADDFRFVRAWWAIPHDTLTRQWFPFAKGGEFSPFYTDVHLVVNWARQGVEVSNLLKPGTNKVASRPQNVRYYFRPGLTWPIKNRFSFKPWPLPRGCIFAHVGPSSFLASDSQGDLSALHALMSSSSFTEFVRVMAGWNYEVGVVQRAPVPHLAAVQSEALELLSRHAWSLRRAQDVRTEISHAFTFPALLQVRGGTLDARAGAWTERIRKLDAELASIQIEIDDHSFDLYRIDADDRRVITQGLSSAIVTADANTVHVGNNEGEVVEDGDSNDEADDEAIDEADDESTEAVAADAATLTTELLSWAVGVAFGRFDLRLSTGERAVPPEPEPFDPLPVCSPGMLTGEDGLPLNAPPSGYAIDFPTDGILVDDAGHPRDLTAAVRAVFEVVFGAAADARWNEAAALLDPRERNLRVWLAQTFFDQHLKRHSKSRRKAPIIWHIATPSADYSIWLYAHRITKDSFFQIQNDLVGPKLALEERKHFSLVQASGPNPSASQRKELAAQEAFIEALRGMLDEVNRIAPLWAPDLNDGIVLTMAPLWRLVPQHKGWQKELKVAWDALCAGRYDWAHLAMHLWPERVVPKCATDRSLAIAHDLEDVFWAAGADGKWKPLATPTKTVEALVAERRSPAVKAALKSLLEAPVASMGGSGRPRKARGTA